MILLEDFMLRALAAGVGVALVGGPLGCFIVWRRMAYFGDAMSHTALLGVALGFLLHVDILLGVVGVGAVLALFLGRLAASGHYGSDTLLGIFSHAALAVGLVALSLMETVRVDLMGYLFGDILAVGYGDLTVVYVGGAAVLLPLILLRRPLLLATVSPDLARAEGVRVELLGLVLMLMIAVVIAAAMKVVGVLLITALLIIPAAAARAVSRTPEAMAAVAAAIGALSVLAGLALSAYLDTPAGPSIVVAAFGMFLLSLTVQRV